MPNEERDASYSILIHAGSEYPTVRYRAHPSIDISHAEYHFRVTVYQSDVQSELQSVYKENLKFTGFTLFSLTHTSIDMHSSPVHRSDVQNA